MQAPGLVTVIMPRTVAQLLLIACGRALEEADTGRATVDVTVDPATLRAVAFTQLRSKQLRDKAEELLAKGPILVLFETHHEDVRIPDSLRERPICALRFGWALQPPIEDMHLDDAGIGGTLVFSGVKHRCFVPWHLASIRADGPQSTADSRPKLVSLPPAACACAGEEIAAGHALGCEKRAHEKSGEWWATPDLGVPVFNPDDPKGAA